MRKYWCPKGSTYTVCIWLIRVNTVTYTPKVDVVTAAVSSGTDRTDLAKVINNWELEGKLSLNFNEWM